MMTNKDEALKMAIEAMTLPNNLSFLMAITACKDALEQPAQAPVAWMSEGGVFTRTKDHAESWSNHGGKVTPVYTHQAPSWQGLSDDEMYEMFNPKFPCDIDESEIINFARSIEQALKEKNK